MRDQVEGDFSTDDDLDLFLTDADGNVVASSATGESYTDGLSGSLPYLGVINWREITPGPDPNPLLGTTLVTVNP